MSTAVNIIKKIMDEAKANVDEIVGKSQLQVEELVSQTRQEALVIKEDMVKKAGEEARVALERNRSNSLLEGGKIRLSARQDLIASLLEGAKAKVENYNKEELSRLYTKMILAMDLKGDEEIILSPQDREKLKNGFCKELNDRLVKRGIKGNLKLSEETLRKGPGFVIRSGRIEINSTFDSLIKMKYSQIEELIVKEIF